MSNFNIDGKDATNFIKKNPAYVREYMDMKRNEILQKHSYKITHSKDGYWRTYVKDFSSKKPQLIKKRKEEKLLDELIKFYSDENSKCLTFKDAYLRWRAVQEKLVTDNTIYKYTTDYNRFFAEKEFESIPISQITEDMLKIYFCETIKQNNLTKGAFKKLYGYVKNTFDKAFRDKVITENPMTFFVCKQFYTYCKEIDKTLEQQIFSTEEMKQIINKLHSEYITHPKYIPNYAVEFAILTGMRVGEIVVLKWDDIYLEEKEPYFLIDKSEKYNRLSKEFFIDKTKNKKARKFPIDDILKKFLTTLKKVQFKYGFHNEWVFTNEEGRLHAPVISSCIKNKCKQLKIPPKGIHALRKTFNSNMRRTGVSEVTASALLGHTPQVNREYYTFDTASLADKTNIIANVHACN